MKKACVILGLLCLASMSSLAFHITSDPVPITSLQGRNIGDLVVCCAGGRDPYANLQNKPRGWAVPYTAYYKRANDGAPIEASELKLTVNGTGYCGEYGTPIAYYPLQNQKEFCYQRSVRTGQGGLAVFAFSFKRPAWNGKTNFWYVRLGIVNVIGVKNRNEIIVFQSEQAPDRIPDYWDYQVEPGNPGPWNTIGFYKGTAGSGLVWLRHPAFPPYTPPTIPPGQPGEINYPRVLRNSIANGVSLSDSETDFLNGPSNPPANGISVYNIKWFYAGNAKDPNGFFVPQAKAIETDEFYPLLDPTDPNTTVADLIKEYAPLYFPSLMLETADSIELSGRDFTAYYMSQANGTTLIPIPI